MPDNECPNCALSKTTQAHLKYELLQTAQQLHDWSHIALSEDWKAEGPVLLRRRADKIREFVANHAK